VKEDGLDRPKQMPPTTATLLTELSCFMFKKHRKFHKQGRFLNIKKTVLFLFSEIYTYI
jgi:hypothetical protein